MQLSLNFRCSFFVHFLVKFSNILTTFLTSLFSHFKTILGNYCIMTENIHFLFYFLFYITYNVLSTYYIHNHVSAIQEKNIH